MSLLSIAQETERPGVLKRYLYALLTDTADPSQPRLLIYPTLGYAPETSWEIGFSTLYVYHAKRDTSNRLSELNAFTFFTLENQYGLWLDHAVYSDKNLWYFFGRLRFQSFPLLFHGIGPNAPADYQARVDGQFTLLKERVLRQIAPSLFAGIEIDYQRLDRVDFKWSEPENQSPLPRGAAGSANLGLGAGLVYDNRHNVLNVRKGFFSELALLHYGQVWGSDFDFNTLLIDNRLYRPVNQRDVLAFQLYGQFIFAGRPPFNQLALLGGENLMRGYYLGRFRDRQLMAAQAEYRLLPFAFAKRWGAAAFASVGQVAPSVDKFTTGELLPAGGLGLRFLLFEQKDIWVRFDVALTREGPGYYFFIGEAF